MDNDRVIAGLRQLGQRPVQVLRGLGSAGRGGCFQGRLAWLKPRCSLE